MNNEDSVNKPHDVQDRGIPTVNSMKKKKGGFLKYLAIVAFIGLVLGIMALAFSNFVLKKDVKVDPDKDKKGNAVQTLPQKTFQAPLQPLTADGKGGKPTDGKPGDGKSDIKLITKDGSQGPMFGKDGERILTPFEQLNSDRFSSTLTPKSSGVVAAAVQGKNDVSVQRGSAGVLGSMLSSTSTPARSASRIKNRSLTLAKGAMIPCVLKTRIDSTVPGMTSCVLPQNIYSDNGKVVLVERGSEITGEYQSELKQGQARLFVLWTRIKTTKGIIIDLDSPGADPLGGAGMPGYVDNHFFERFGGAILLSLISDGISTLAQYAQQSASSGSGNTMVYQSSSSNGQQMATEALKNTINIPPTLYKNQGDRISVFVARDLTFDRVYEIKPL
jgi:type IV secretion system protein VirB10